MYVIVRISYLHPWKLAAGIARVHHQRVFVFPPSPLSRHPDFVLPASCERLPKCRSFFWGSNEETDRRLFEKSKLVREFIIIGVPGVSLWSNKTAGRGRTSQPCSVSLKHGRCSRSSAVLKYPYPFLSGQGISRFTRSLLLNEHLPFIMWWACPRIFCSRRILL